MTGSTSSPVAPRPSATVVILRDSSNGPEILMVRRRAGDAFGESYTYPGGLVDADESNAQRHACGIDNDQADALLGVANGIDYYSAVIRELFEETGVLLARDASGTWAPDARSFGRAREDVDAGTMKWCDFLTTHRLSMACDALHYFAYWVTPVTLPKRWSTRFFLAALPPGQEAIHDGKELTDARWLTAADALGEYAQRELKLPHPTVRTLEQLVAHDSIEALYDWADGLARDGVPRFTSVRVEIDGKTRWLDPWDPGYPGDGGD